MTDRDLFAASRNVSRETLDRLDIYASLLVKWNSKINLIASSTADTIWSRHFLDSAQLLDIAPEAERWGDFGSGGGFPGLVLAILSAGEGRGTEFSLVESDLRKAAFLSTVAREVGVRVKVLPERAELLSPLGANVVSARALAPLPRLLGLLDRHLVQGGVAIVPKGAGADAELKEALALRSFEVQKFPSRTDPHGVILRIGGLSRG